MTNVLLNTDSYKSSHAMQYPPKTEYVYSYVESRGGRFDKTLFFGLQAWIKEYLLKPISQKDIDEAEEFWAAHGEPFYKEGWQHILDNHNGYLPVEIKAVPEGLVIPGHNVLATIVNTDPKCWWLTSYLETQMLRAIWYPTTVATLSWHCKQIIKQALEKTSDDVSQVMFKLHDFGARGASSLETAALGGMAHLVNFMGTDTVSGVLAARKYYGEKMAGFSIPAAEHSTMTSWGKDRETEAFRNMITQFGGPNKLVAVVSDSFDIYNAAEHIWGETLKDEVLASGTTVVVRPDSGDPLTVPIKLIELLAAKFGYTVNTKGYKVLNSAVRVIQGDGITIDSLPVIIKNLIDAGYAMDNLAFGMGAGLLQKVDRDTLKFALKTSAAMVDGKWIDVFKSPIEDKGKESKKGKLALAHYQGIYETVPLEGHKWEDVMQTVFVNGVLVSNQSFTDIRERSNY